MVLQYSSILTYGSEDGGGKENRLDVVPAYGEVLRHHVDTIVHCLLHYGLIVHQELVDCLIKTKYSKRNFLKFLLTSL